MLFRRNNSKRRTWNRDAVSSLRTPFYSIRLTFIPKQTESRNKPLHCDKECHGENLKCYTIDYKKNKNELNLKWLICAYNQLKNEETFFNNFFVKISGTKMLQEQIEQGLSEEEIRESWQEGLDEYRMVRVKYLLYNDF